MQNKKELEKTYWSIRKKFGQATKGYSMLEDGDKILIALSGGKDSLTMLKLLAEQSKVYKPKISIVAAPETNELNILQIVPLCRMDG